MDVPENIVWNEDDPPTVFQCSQHTEHADGCNGTCATVVLTENQCELLNEARSWARLGLDVNGLSANSFDTQLTVDSIIEVLVGMNILEREALDDLFRMKKLTVMRDMRKELEPQIRAARLQEKLGIPTAPLFGPNGKRIT